MKTETLAPTQTCVILATSAGMTQVWVNDAGIREPRPMTGYVYIITNKRNGTLYTGVTSDVRDRMHQHSNNLTPGFASSHNCKILVWFERHPNIVLAIQREKTVKEYPRQWKLNLIEGLNPHWYDLTDAIDEIDNPYVPKPGSAQSRNYD
ncbi:MAG: GIY-YIG nuclease family protein [Ahrensia sp.]